MRMRKIIIALMLAAAPCLVQAQSFASLWKNVTEAQQKDLPKTQGQWLEKIVSKAKREKQYGQLLKAETMRAAANTQVSPDSADIELGRLEQQAEGAKDPVLRAVLSSVVGKLHRQRGGQEHVGRSQEWFRRSMENLDLLAQQKSTDYTPAVMNGIDSRIFYNDLLHVIGMEAEDYGTLRTYYEAHGNRAAACICAYYELMKDRKADVMEVRKSRYLQRIDSLINVYADLREAGELAIEHYNFISQATDATAQDRYNYINYALSRWGAWPRMNVLRNAQTELQNPSYNINIGDCMLLPNAERLVRVNSIRNIGELTLNVYRLKVNGDTQLDPNSKEDYAKLQRLIVPGMVQTVTRRYIGQPVWKESSDSITLEPMPIGVYLIETLTDNSGMTPQRALLRVSDLYVMHEELPDRHLRFVVVNATTGKPVQEAHIVLSRGARYDDLSDTKTASLTTGHNGEADYQYTVNSKPDKIYIYTDEDKACGSFGLADYYMHWEKRAVEHRINVYTDRSIYRPGQQLHVAAIVFDTNNEALKSKARGDREVTFTLHDANGKTVATQKATTDQWGTAFTDLTLPSQGLTGRFSIVARTDDAYGSESVNVEQYKRPTFEITFDPYKQSYQAGDTVSVKGTAKTYAGMPVQGAKVTYQVKRRPAYWWTWLENADTSTLLQDSTVTAQDGTFEVKLPMEFPANADLTHTVLYNIIATAKVTDSAGETHEATTRLPLSNRNHFLQCDLPEKQLRDSLNTITFTYKNTAGEPVDEVLRYRFDNGSWKVAATNKPVAIGQKLTSGLHRLTAICGTDTLQAKTVLFSYSDKKVAVPTHDWFYVSGDSFSDGSPVYLQVGSSDDDMHIYYSICSGKRVLEKGSKVLNNEVETRRFTYRDTYGDGICINMAWVKRGTLYKHTVTLQRPLPDERLNLTWKTFRDRLTPGQKEQWTLHVARPDGKPAQSQLLATMYDKSLDQILRHSWNLNNGYSLFIPYTQWDGGSNATAGLYDFLGYKALSERELSFDHWDEQMFEWASPYTFFANTRSVMMVGAARSVKIRGTGSVKARAKMEAATAAEDVEASDAIDSEDELKEPMVKETGGDSETTQQAPALRENLNETAFFYPTLQTNAQGDADISFTLPESVTTWHFMGIAHDERLYNGQISADAVASKTVMVQPNLPRFIRRSDKTQVASRISNTSKHHANGTATLQLIDPETEAVVCEWNKPFEVAAGATTEVSFDVDGEQLASKGNGQSLFIARVMARGKGFSDGEQHYLPLLPDREPVLTTVPFTQHEAGEKTIDLTTLFPSGSSNKKLTLEYTNHPAWLMIQALPTVANPWEDNALSLATAIYANAIGQKLLNTSPKIGQTIKLWQQETGKETSLMSSLQKNEELKTMVLSETPWVADAEQETDQKQKLAGFLDESTIGYRLSHFTDKLKALQNSDGSFSWWPGMHGSSYMTMAVTEILTRLNTLTGKQQGTTTMLDKAFPYLDKVIAEEVNEMKREEKKGNKHIAPSELACSYLYTNALAGRKQTADITYLVGLLDKMPTELTIYGKAGSAMILAQYGKTQRAKEYLQSISEYTVYKEEMGRYFDTHSAQYSWFDYRIPTQVAAIEAMKALTPGDTKTIEDMQRWLLMEKRATGWDTPFNAVNAVYAFLADKDGKADMSLLTTGENATFAVDGHQVETPKATAGLGYIKTAVPESSGRTLTISKTSAGTSWGAVYAQFYQKSDEIKSQSAGISIRREILADDDQPTASVQRVGAKIRVRITITADRDYDFVQVQDKRPACLEPVQQLSGYRGGYYCAPHDNETNYYFDQLAKGKHVVETDYYVDRAGTFGSGTCTVQCAYSPEYSGREGAFMMKVVK